MATKRKKAKAKKTTKRAVKKSSKPKTKKSAKPKKRVTAKKSRKPKARAAAIASQFNGSYASSVEQITSMNGTLTIPDPNNSNNVLYTVGNSSYSVTPSFNGNLISFNFNKGGVTYNYSALTWTPAASGSGGTWTGIASGPPSLILEKGDWNAGTG